SIVPTTTHASSRSRSAPTEAASPKSRPRRATRSSPPRWAASSDVAAAPSRVMSARSSALAGRAASIESGNQLFDLAADRLAVAVRGFVGADGLEVGGVEAGESLDDLRRREGVVSRDREARGGVAVGARCGSGVGAVARPVARAVHGRRGGLGLGGIARLHLA